MSLSFPNPPITTYYMVTSTGPIGFNIRITPDKELRDDWAKALSAEGYLVRAYSGTFDEMIEKARLLEPTGGERLAK